MTKKQYIVTCGLTTQSNSVAELVATFVREKFKGNMVHFATHADLQRGFIIDIREGRYARTREGHRLATGDLRYAKLGSALGFTNENLTAFLELISNYQSSSAGGELVAIEVSNAITYLRAELLRACPSADPVILEGAIGRFRERIDGCNKFEKIRWCG